MLRSSALAAAALLAACTSEPEMHPMEPIDRLIADACTADIIGMGENGQHGDGRTMSMISVYVSWMIERCGIDIVAIEAPTYDLEALHLKHLDGERIELDEFLAAFGTLHRRNLDMRPIFMTLLDRVNAGELRVVGLDDQFHAHGTRYLPESLAQDLFATMPGDRQAQCRSRWEADIRWQFSPGTVRDADYGQGLLDCLSEAEAFLDVVQPAARQRAHRRMISSLRNALRRGVKADGEITTRPSAMAGRLLDYMDEESRLRGETARGVVWTNTFHMSRSGWAASQADPPGTMAMQLADQSRYSLFTVGFTALDGQTRGIDGTIAGLPPKPDDSLEVIAMNRTDDTLAYVGPDDLAALGTLPVALYSHKPRVETVAEAFDAVVVLRTEAPAKRDTP